MLHSARSTMRSSVPCSSSTGGRGLRFFAITRHASEPAYSGGSFTWTSSGRWRSPRRQPAHQPPDAARERMFLEVVVPEQQAVLVERDAHVARADSRLGDSPLDGLTVVADAGTAGGGLRLLEGI